MSKLSMLVLASSLALTGCSQGLTTSNVPATKTKPDIVITAQPTTFPLFPTLRTTFVRDAFRLTDAYDRHLYHTTSAKREMITKMDACVSAIDEHLTELGAGNIPQKSASREIKINAAAMTYDFSDHLSATNSLRSLFATYSDLVKRDEQDGEYLHKLIENYQESYRQMNARIVNSAQHPLPMACVSYVRDLISKTGCDTSMTHHWDFAGAEDSTYMAFSMLSLYGTQKNGQREVIDYARGTTYALSASWFATDPTVRERLSDTYLFCAWMALDEYRKGDRSPKTVGRLLADATIDHFGNPIEAHTYLSSISEEDIDPAIRILVERNVNTFDQCNEMLERMARERTALRAQFNRSVTHLKEVFTRHYQDHEQ